MLGTSPAFHGFSVDDLAAARTFYADTLGLDVTEENAMLVLHLARGARTLVYPKPDHVPATYTILNFPVADVEATVDPNQRGSIRMTIEISDLRHLERAAEARLDGMTVVVDCANGAASRLAPELLRRLGATVHPIHAEPDGSNINAGCGALHPEVAAAEVVRLGADAGVSHDGDADRALFADAEGKVTRRYSGEMPIGEFADEVERLAAR